MVRMFVKENFAPFLSSADFFFQKQRLQKKFRNSIRMSNGLDPDQDRHYVGPDLDQNCLKSLSADDKSHR